MLDRAAGGGEQGDLVGLALDPRVGDAEGGRPEPADALAVARGERDEGVVDDDLGDVHRVRAVVSHGELDLAGAQDGALDRQLLDGRPGAIAEPGSAQERQQRRGAGDQGKGDQAQRPRGGPRGEGRALGAGACLHQPLHLEEAHPAELGELADVGVEHVAARLREAQLEDPALPLRLHDRVRELGRLERGAGRVVVEEVGVDVEGVDRVELQRVDEVDPHQLAASHADGLVHVVEADRVHRVDLIRAVEVGVEAVHHHHQLVGLGAATPRIDRRTPRTAPWRCGTRAASRGSGRGGARTERRRTRRCSCGRARSGPRRAARRSPARRPWQPDGCRGSGPCEGARSRWRT